MVKKNREKMNEKLDELYGVSPYEKDFRNKTIFNEIKIGSPVYGEVTKNGTNSIVNKFKKYFNSDTVFYDLGSGLSKMVIHIGLVYGVKKSVGIEYSKERHKGAMYLKDKYAPNCDNIEIICGNAIEQDLSEATVVYMDNTVFPDDVTRQIYEILPPKTLVLYKKSFNFLPKEIKQNKDENLVERTYNQGKLMWVIKE